MSIGTRAASLAFIGALAAAGLVGCDSADTGCSSAAASYGDLPVAAPAALVAKGGGSGGGGGHSSGSGSSGGHSGSSGSSGRTGTTDSGSKPGTSGRSGSGSSQVGSGASKPLSLAKAYSAPLRPSAVGGGAGSRVASNFSGYGPSSYGGGFNYYYMGHPYPWYMGPSFYSSGARPSCPSPSPSGAADGSGGGF